MEYRHIKETKRGEYTILENDVEVAHETNLAKAMEKVGHTFQYTPFNETTSLISLPR